MWKMDHLNFILRCFKRGLCTGKTFIKIYLLFEVFNHIYYVYGNYFMFLTNCYQYIILLSKFIWKYHRIVYPGFAPRPSSLICLEGPSLIWGMFYFEKEIGRFEGGRGLGEGIHSPIPRFTVRVIASLITISWSAILWRVKLEIALLSEN